MKSFQIKKWQDNVFTDVYDKKLGDENLINALLEVSFQLAELNENRECWLDPNLFAYIAKAIEQGQRSIVQAIEFKSTKSRESREYKYSIWLGRWELPIHVYKLEIR